MSYEAIQVTRPNTRSHSFIYSPVHSREAVSFVCLFTLLSCPRALKQTYETIKVTHYNTRQHSLIYLSLHSREVEFTLFTFLLSFNCLLLYFSSSKRTHKCIAVIQTPENIYLLTYQDSEVVVFTLLTCSSCLHCSLPHFRPPELTYKYVTVTHSHTCT